MEYYYIFIVLFATLAIGFARPTEEEKKEKLRPFDCKPCTQICPKKLDCAFGTVKDRCGCCDVCGVGLDSRCDLIGKEYKHGSCGRDMICRLRKDPEHRVEDQALCTCTEKKPVCGTNNETYESICHLTLAQTVDKELKLQHREGPCRAVPTIKTAPVNKKKPVGNNVFLSCEAKGYPIPGIEWKWVDSENTSHYLPNDDVHISVNNRGGPEKYMITGWLQIMNLQRHHEGDYICVARNEVGEVQETARVNIDIRDNDDL